MLIEDKFGAGQAVEMLKFTMKAEMVDRFIELDHDLWTVQLASVDGFVSKDVWVDAAKPGEVTTVIYWKTLEQWKAIDHGWLADLDKRFTELMGGPGSFTLEALHDGKDLYRVRQTVKLAAGTTL